MFFYFYKIFLFIFICFLSIYLCIHNIIFVVYSVYLLIFIISMLQLFLVFFPHGRLWFVITRLFFVLFYFIFLFFCLLSIISLCICSPASSSLNHLLLIVATASLRPSSQRLAPSACILLLLAYIRCPLARWYTKTQPNSHRFIYIFFFCFSTINIFHFAFFVMLNLINFFNIRYVVSLVFSYANAVLYVCMFCVCVCFVQVYGSNAVFILYIYLYIYNLFLFCVYLILSLCIRFPIFGFVLTVVGCCFWFFLCLFMFLLLGPYIPLQCFRFFILFAFRFCVFQSLS